MIVIGVKAFIELDLYDQVCWVRTIYLQFNKGYLLASIVPRRTFNIQDTFYIVSLWWKNVLQIIEMFFTQ